MSRKKPTVVVTRRLPEAVETRMMELFETRLNRDDIPMSPAQLAEAVRTADVLVPTVTDRIDRAVIEAGGNPYGASYASNGRGADLAAVLRAARFQGARLARYARAVKTLRADTAMTELVDA